MLIGITLMTLVIAACKTDNVPTTVSNRIKVVKEKTSDFPAPSEKEHIYELMTGKVIKVIGEEGPWYQIEFFSYGEPIGGEKWIKKESVVGYDPHLLKEGYVKPGASIYDEHGAVKEKTHQNPIFIRSDRGDVYEIEAPGGIWGFIKKSDFIPDSFQKQDRSL